MLTLEEAVTRIGETLSPLGRETVPLADALGRVLARPLVARRSLPSFDNSAMDGYAVRAAELSGANETSPGRLRVAHTIPAGARVEVTVAAGEAARIFTGAPMPKGADAVVMQEDTEREGDTVLIRKAPRLGEHVRPIGDDVHAGVRLLDTGAVLGPGDIGMLASQGECFVEVVRRPRVAIVPTGDELVEIDTPLPAGGVPNSNAHLLTAQVEAAGGVAIRCPIAPDEPKALAAALAAAARGVDLVVSCGGVSVGDFDYVREVLGDAGAVDFWKVAIKPGKPLAFGRVHGVPLVGMPGNPVSSFVCFELFGRVAIRKLGGYPDLERRRLPVTLTSDLKPDKRRRELVRARLRFGGREILATPLSQRGSAHQMSMLQIDALLDVPPGETVLPSGSRLSAFWLAG